MSPDKHRFEFAFAIGKPEAVILIEKYNYIRFGGGKVTYEEQAEIEDMIRSLQV